MRHKTEDLPAFRRPADPPARQPARNGEPKERSLAAWARFHRPRARPPARTAEPKAPRAPPEPAPGLFRKASHRPWRPRFGPFPRNLVNSNLKKHSHPSDGVPKGPTGETNRRNRTGWCEPNRPNRTDPPRNRTEPNRTGRMMVKGLIKKTKEQLEKLLRCSFFHEKR